MPPSSKAYGGKRKHSLVRHPRRRRGPRTVPAGSQGRTGRRPRRGRTAQALPARRHPQGLRVLRPRPQRSADHAHRRRLPQHQRISRIRFDLYACVRPVRYFKGVDAPNKRADKVDMVIFRENTEDVYCGIEFKWGSERAKKLIDLLKEMGYTNVAAVGGHRHQADQPRGQQAPGAHGRPLRPRQEAAQRHADAQGQHHEVHRGRLQGLGLRGGRAGVPRRASSPRTKFTRG